MFTVARRIIARAAAWLAVTLAEPRQVTPDRPKRPGLGVTEAAVASAASAPEPGPYAYPVAAYKPPAGVLPSGVSFAPVAMDSAANSTYSALATIGAGQIAGFPGYAYLSGLATLPEFRLMSSSLATEMCREWITFHGSDSDGDDTSERIKEIEAEFTALGVREAMQKAIEQDAQHGRAQIFLDVRRGDVADPLILDPRTITKGSFKGIQVIEPIWTTPAKYNSTDPTEPNFYRPSSWYIMGREYHAHRLITIVTRPVPDIFKPAFNFGGMSLYQLTERTVDNWLKVRDAVTDLIHKFSLTAIKTDMSGILDGTDETKPAALLKRVQLFIQHRNNRGMLVLDNQSEDLVQINTPLSGLHELQAQSQEQMCMYARMPAVVLTGLSPNGLNASSDGEIRAFYDWIAAQQESHMRKPIQTILELVQLSKWGVVDKRIGFSFVPLYQMTPEQLANIQKTKADTDSALIDRGILDPSEARERLASDKDSGYHGLDVDAVPVPPGDDPDPDDKKAPEGAREPAEVD